MSKFYFHDGGMAVNDELFLKRDFFILHHEYLKNESAQPDWKVFWKILQFSKEFGGSEGLLMIRYKN